VLRTWVPGTSGWSSGGLSSTIQDLRGALVFPMVRKLDPGTSSVPNRRHSTPTTGNRTHTLTQTETESEVGGKVRDTAEYSSAHNADLSVFVPWQFSAAGILIATTIAVTSLLLLWWELL
jgi:hypothetical protein